MASFFSKYYFSSDQKSSHNPALDGLRGLAVLLVVLAHLSNNKILLFDFLNFGGIGKSGVYLFFLLSSYLLDRQIVLAIKSGNSKVYYWLNYFLRRFLRIYPLYLFLLIAYYIIHKMGYEYCICMRNFKVIFSHLTLKQGNGLFWSIPVEFKYYFLSPLIILIYAKVLRWNKLLILLLTMAGICYISYFTYTNGYFKKTEISTWPYLPVFLLGSLIAVFQVLLSIKVKTKIVKYSMAIDIIGLIALFLCFILGAGYFFRILVPSEYRFVFNIYRRLIIVQGFIFMLIILSTIYGKGIMSRIFSFKPLRFIGVISFSIYLTHFPVLKFIKDLNTDNYSSELKFTLFFILTITISMITYHLIEYPFSKIKVFENDKLFRSKAEEGS